MTKEEIIEMAKQAGLMADGEMWFSPTYGSGDVHISHLESFAKLVAEKAAEQERESCAKVCDVLAVHPEYASSITKLAAQAIRNRGQS